MSLKDREISKQVIIFSATENPKARNKRLL